MPHNRIEGRVGVERRALIGDPPGLSFQPGKAFRNKPRLADAGFAGDQHHLAFALRGLLPTLHEHADLMFAPDKLAEALAVHRVEPAFRTLFAVHPPDSDRRFESFKGLLAEVGERKLPANKFQRLLGDDDGILTGGGLEPCSPVRSLPDHRTLLVDARADEIADDDLARRYADARRERCPIRRDKLSDRGNCRQGRSHGARCIVFMRLRPAEIDEQAIPERLCHIAAETDNFVADRLLVPRDDVLHVLRVEPRGELGRNPRGRRTSR